MITTIAITFIIDVFGAIMAMLNAPVITALPYGMDNALQTTFAMVYGVWDDLWPIQIVIFATLAFLAYKLFMVWLQMFLGSRVSHG